MHEVGWSKFLEDPECQAELLGLCLKVMRSLSRGRNLVGFIYRKMDSECTNMGCFGEKICQPTKHQPVRIKAMVTFIAISCVLKNTDIGNC